MRVVNYVLRTIRDDEQMAKQITNSKAIGEIVHLYNDFALADGAGSRGLYVCNGETYGSDFKSYISYLPAAEQLKLLDRYLLLVPRRTDRVGVDEAEEPELDLAPENLRAETPEVKEGRRLRHWVIKTLVWFMLFLITMVIGATVSILVRNHALDNSLIKSMMDTATELAKIILSAAAPAK